MRICTHHEQLLMYPWIHEPDEYDKYQERCREEVKRLKEQINNWPKEEVEPMTLNCEVCGAPIESHYGELTVSIQPHVIKDGTFWTIDNYVPDVMKRKLLCEPCIIHLKKDYANIEDEMLPYTRSELWILIKQSFWAWYRKVRS